MFMPEMRDVRYMSTEHIRKEIGELTKALGWAVGWSALARLAISRQKERLSRLQGELQFR